MITDIAVKNKLTEPEWLQCVALLLSVFNLNERQVSALEDFKDSIINSTREFAVSSLLDITNAYCAQKMVLRETK
jgi:hypothetical protein